MLCNSKLIEQRTKVDESKLILLSCVRLEIWLHNGIYCVCQLLLHVLLFLVLVTFCILVLTTVLGILTLHNLSCNRTNNMK